MKCLTWASLSSPPPLGAYLMASLAPSVAKVKEMHANAGLGHGPPSGILPTHLFTHPTLTEPPRQEAPSASLT